MKGVNRVMVAFNAEWLMMHSQSSVDYNEDAIQCFIDEGLQRKVDFFVICCPAREDISLRQKKAIRRLANDVVPIFQGRAFDCDSEIVKYMSGARESSNAHFCLQASYHDEKNAFIRNVPGRFSMIDENACKLAVYDMENSARMDFIPGMTALLACRYVYGYILCI